MLLNDLLNEHIVNLRTPAEKRAYADRVWELLQQSYSSIGGFKSASSPEELVADSGLWKLVTRNGELTAVNVYKDSFGRKAIASGTNGTPQGRVDYRMVKDEDFKLKRAWAEVSGAVERIMVKNGGRPIPAKYAEILTGKKVLEIDDDGAHYTRLIAGHPHEKVIYGFVNLSSADVANFEALGIDVQQLPDQFVVNKG